MDIIVNVSGFSNEANIEISANKNDFIRLGSALIEINDFLEVVLKEKKSIYYKFNLSSMIFKIDDKKNTILVRNGVIEFFSEKDTFFRLGMSIINFFKESCNNDDHFHIDKYDGFFNDMDYELVFISLN